MAAGALLLFVQVASATDSGRATAAPAALLMPTQLSVNYWAPTDVAASTISWVDPSAAPPRFSWQLQATAAAPRGVAQSAYRLQVESITGTTVWDSGRVQSNDTLHIEMGAAVEPDTRYRWR